MTSQTTVLTDPPVHPRPGRKLPRELRPEAVGSLAAAFPAGLRDPGFAELIARIDDSPVFEGNAVTVFFRGADAFAAMREAVEAARREVLAESYIWKDDDTGQEALEVLGRAAARGVTVRVLADAWGSMTTRRDYWKRMRALGIEVRLFNPIFPHIIFQPFRDHRKIIVVDRRIAFTGGMNIADEYRGGSGGSRGGPWRDTHARAVGPAAVEMAGVFWEAWTRAGGRGFPALEPPGDAPAGPARVLVLDSRPGRGHGETASVLAAIAAAARERLWITNAYFAPRRRAIDHLARTRARGVDVRLLLPGPTDVPIVRHAGHGWFEALRKAGVRIFEYQPAILHAKTVVADDFVSFVGSSNLDFRSFHFNAECNLVILDEQTANTLADAFEEDLASSREIDDRWIRPLPHRIGDALARRLSPLL